MVIRQNFCALLTTTVKKTNSQSSN